MKIFKIWFIILFITLSSFQFVFAQEELPSSPLEQLRWERLGGPHGGVGYEIKINQDNHNILYVTDANAGIHRSDDGGRTWYQINSGITTFAGLSGDSIPVYSVTIDPHNSNIVWIGLQNSRGIYKSIDGGRTWIIKVNGITDFAISFRNFAVDPNNSDIVYAAGEISSHEWAGSSLNGVTFDRTMGKVYRTTNGGDHWELIWKGDNLARYVIIDPQDTKVIYISTGIFDREAANTNVELGEPGGIGVIKSIDGGKTWFELNEKNGLHGLYIGSLVMDPNNPSRLLAAAGHDVWTNTPPTGGKKSPSGIFLTEDGGEKWERVGGLSQDVMMAVEFCSVNPKIAYAAGTISFYKSSDGGQTWKVVSPPNEKWGPPGLIAGLPIDIQCGLEDENIIYVNNYVGGNLFSNDGGKSWVTSSVGYSGAEIVGGLLVDPKNPGHLYAGARSGLFVSEDGGHTWEGRAYEPVRFSDINAITFHPENFNEIFSTPWDLCWGIPKSDDGGRTWAILDYSGNFHKVCENALAFSSLEVSPFDQDLVIAVLGNPNCFINEGCKISKIDERGIYRLVGNRFIKQNYEEFEDKFITATKFHYAKSDTWYVITFENGVYVTENDGGSFSKLSESYELQKPRILAIDPTNSDYMYLGLRGNGIYRSADGGKSWNWASAGLEFNSYVTDIEIDPVHSNILYASLQTSGVFVSNDYGLTWRNMNDGLTHRNINYLALSKDGNTLYAGSLGSGVFRISIHEQAYFDNLAPTPTITALPTHSPTISETKIDNTPLAIATNLTITTNTPEFAIIEDKEVFDNYERNDFQSILIGVILLLIVIGGTVLILRRRKFNDKN